MKARVVILNGTLTAFVDGGDFEGARAGLETLLAGLGAEGIQLIQETPIEQHKHHDEEVLTHEHEHAN